MAILFSAWGPSFIPSLAYLPMGFSHHYDVVYLAFRFYCIYFTLLFLFLLFATRPVSRLDLTIVNYALVFVAAFCSFPACIPAVFFAQLRTGNYGLPPLPS